MNFVIQEANSYLSNLAFGSKSGPSLRVSDYKLIILFRYNLLLGSGGQICNSMKSTDSHAASKLRLEADPLVGKSLGR